MTKERGPTAKKVIKSSLSASGAASNKKEKPTDGLMLPPGCVHAPPPAKKSKTEGLLPAVRTKAPPPVKKSKTEDLLPAVRTKAPPPAKKSKTEGLLPAVRTKAPPPVKKSKTEDLLPAVRTKAPPPALRPQARVPEKKESAGALLSPDPLRAYLNEVRRFKLLDRAEENILVADYAQTGNQESAQKLITANLRLVVKIAMELQSHWLNNLMDLIQEGNIGLIQALKKFDPGRGVKFSYYASYWIKAYILKYIMDNWRMVKVGTTQAQRKLFYNLRKEQEKILREGLEPGPKLLAERLGVQESEVEEMGIRLSGREVSLDAPLGADSDQTQVSILPAEDEGADNFLASAQLKNILQDKLTIFRESLTPRENIIMEKRLLAEDPVTLQEIGEEFSISRERVRQLEERLKKNLLVFLRKEMPDLEENY